MFKNNAPFRSCITKIYSTLIDSAEDLNIVYNLLEYCQNYSMTSGSLRSYYREKIDNVDDVSDGKSFKYETKRIGKTEARPDCPAQPRPDEDGNPQPQPNQQPIPPLNTEAVVPLQYLSNFWRSLDLL